MSPTSKSAARPLEGKVVIVTGGNSGIGEGIVREAASYITATTIIADGGLMQKPGAV